MDSVKTDGVATTDDKSVVTYVDIEVKVGGKSVFKGDMYKTSSKPDKFAKHLYRKHANEEKPAMVEFSRVSKTNEDNKRKFKYNVSREPLKKEVELNGRKITHKLKTKSVKKNIAI
jgi:hypothetical protein